MSVHQYVYHSFLHSKPRLPMDREVILCLCGQACVFTTHPNGGREGKWQVGGGRQAGVVWGWEGRQGREWSPAQPAHAPAPSSSLSVPVLLFLLPPPCLGRAIEEACQVCRIIERAHGSGRCLGKGMCVWERKGQKKPKWGKAIMEQHVGWYVLE